MLQHLDVEHVHQEVAFSVLWWRLEKEENSDSDECIRLWAACCKLFPDAPSGVSMRWQWICGAGV